MSANNLAAALYTMAETHPDQLAIALPARPGKALPTSGPIPYREISFRALAEETDLVARGLRAAGFEPGDRVVLMVPPSVAFITLSFALLQSGIIPVLIDPGIGLKNLKTCIGEARPVGFIGITKAHAARVLLGWGRQTIKKKITLGTRLFWGGPLLDQIKAAARPGDTVTCFEARPDDLAGISFTSGSTGLSKGVMVTHGNMRQQVEVIRRTFDMRPGEVDLPTFPPFALFNPTLGVSTVLPDMNPTRPAGVDPERIIRAVRQFRVTTMFGSPALLDRVGRYGEARGIQLPTLGRVLSAGAPVPGKTLRRFATMLNPETQIYTVYGATEALPVARIGSRQLLTEAIQQRSASGGGICIGKPVAGVSVKVIHTVDEPITEWLDTWEVPDGVVGEIAVKGDNVTPAYFRRPQATQLAKIPDGDSFWHRMGDLGYVGDDGNLWFCGRKAHRVQLADRVLYSVQCESVFNQHPQVHRSALVGVDGQAILCVELDREAVRPDPSKIRRELLDWAARHDLTRDIRTILFHPGFPVDIRHNAKIGRGKLAVWAAKQKIGNK